MKSIHNVKPLWCTILLLIVIASCTGVQKNLQKSSNLIKDTSNIPNTKIDRQLRSVTKASIAPKIDGLATDAVWQRSEWHPLDQNWLGAAYTTEDFSGRYKLAWTPEALYILAEITDDQLYDKEKDPLTLWWDDDCLEIFIDADNSGGGHQFNHNAFAYHVALDGNVVDVAPGSVPTLYNSHVISEKKTTGTTTLWECKLFVFDDSYTDGELNTSLQLEEGLQLGFALAYCDNDTSAARENFIGSIAIEGLDKNRGWIDAGVFGTIVLDR